MRLLPPLLAVLVFQAIMALNSGVSYHEEWTSLASVVFYYSNWKLAFNSTALGGNIAPGLQHLWSLALEEQFYFIWPLVTIFFLTIRTKLRTVVIVLTTLIVAIAIHRALMYNGPNSWYADFIRTDTRADGILLGCLLAHVWMRYREPKRGVKIAASISAIFLLICLPLVNTTAPFLFDGGISAIDLACAVIILALLDGQWKGSKFFSLKPFIILGTVSYALYLWHLPIYFGIRYHAGGWPTPVRISVAVLATFFFTALSWFFIEKPIMEWKDRIEGHAYVERLSLSTVASWFSWLPWSRAKRSRPVARLSRRQPLNRSGDGAFRQGHRTGAWPPAELGPGMFSRMDVIRDLLPPRRSGAPATAPPRAIRSADSGSRPARTVCVTDVGFGLKAGTTY